MEDVINQSASHLGSSLKILFRKWNGSVYQAVAIEALIYLIFYISITLIYDFALDDGMRRNFEAVATHASKYSASVIPIVLLLGNFTTLAINRWFAIYKDLPGTAKVITTFTMTLKDNLKEQGVIYSDLYARWTVLSWALTLRLICKPFAKYLGSLSDMQKTHLLMKHERKTLEPVSESQRPLTVLDWMENLLKRVQEEDGFAHHDDYNRSSEVILFYKKTCTNLLKFNWRNIPLALQQVVGLTIYVLGLTSCLGRQFSESDRVSFVLSGYIPVLPLIQYFLYYAWWKIGCIYSNPFGEDTDDLDIVDLFVRHIRDAQRLTRNYNPDDNFLNESLKHSGKSIEEISF